MSEQVELRFEAQTDGSAGVFQEKMLEYIPSEGAKNLIRTIIY